MSGERLAALAVDATVDYLDTNIASYLAAVESARSLAAGTLSTPVDIISTNLPDYGGDTPLIEIFENGGQQIKQAGFSSKLWEFTMSLVLAHACDADIEAGHIFVRDYVTAITDALMSEAGRTLSGRVHNLSIERIDFASGKSGARHFITAAMDLVVSLFDDAPANL